MRIIDFLKQNWFNRRKKKLSSPFGLSRRSYERKKNNN